MSLVAKKPVSSSAALLAIFGLLTFLVPLGCGKSDTKQSGTVPDQGAEGKQDAASATSGGSTDKDASAESNPATDVLRKMIAAYRAAMTYSDQGSVRLIIDRPMKPVDDKASFSVALQRPNKLHLKLYQADVVADGEKIAAKIADLPGQYRTKPLKGDLKIEEVFFDPVLVQVMSQGQAGLSLPLVMLMDKEDPMRILLREAEKPVLDAAGEIDGKPCYRVKLRRPDGTAILWIDKATYALRRVNVPTDNFFKALQQEGPVTSVAVTAEFTDATLGAKIRPETFVFETPPKADPVKYFVPPNAAQLLGKAAPQVKFTDLEGKELSLADLAGKVIVLEFWSSLYEPCRKSLPLLAKAAEQFKDNKNVVFLAVNVDSPDIDKAELTATMNKLGLQVPIVRDTADALMREFRTVEIPAVFIISPKGILQYYEVIGNPGLAAPLPEKIDAVLAGKDIFDEPLEKYTKALAQYEAEMERLAKAEKLGEGSSQEQEIPRADIAKPSDPKTIKLTSLWTCKELKAPGNILIVSDKGQTDRIIVIEGLKGVVELGPDGKIAAENRFKLDETEVVSALRTATDRDGNRYYAAFASAQQRFHLFDKGWKQIFSFPEDALENKHDGIADVELGDLNADGVPEAYVGYWGLVGIQAVSLEGKRTASNRKINDVVRCAVSGPDKDGLRGLFCANRRGNLAVLDSQLQQITELSVPNRLLTWVVSAPLTSDPNLSWCALCSPRLGDNIALGIDLDGRELWNYPLPEGVHPQPIEPIVAGSIDGKTGVWLLAGSDGSIHIVAPDGTPIDRFNYGKPLCGMATVLFDGRPVLLVASPDGVEALKVE